MDNTYIYTIDENDKIVEVSPNWADFARENGGKEDILPPLLYELPLWKYIADAETRYLYHLLIDNIRKGAMEFTVPIQCDSPDLKRFIQIRMQSLPENKIRFTSTIIKTQPREALLLLDPQRAQDQSLVRICSFCKKIDIGHETWVETEEAVLHLHLLEKDKMPGLTHGVCPSCYAEVMDELKAYHFRKP